VVRSVAVGRQGKVRRAREQQRDFISAMAGMQMNVPDIAKVIGVSRRQAVLLRCSL
jgi:hypothetical protein